VKALVQRVRSAAVDIEGREVAAIDRGLLVFLGVAADDSEADAEWMAGKIARLRIFDDVEGRMNLDAAAAGGRYLVVSQFTLFANCRKGNRPSYLDAAPPERADALYEEFVRALRAHGCDVQTGVFRAAMRVRLINDGPVTIPIESPPRR